MPVSNLSMNELRAMDASRMAGRIDPEATRRAQEKPLDPADEEEAQEFLPVRRLRAQFIDYFTTKVDEIEEQKEARRYYHGAQLTSDQLRVLRERRQPPQVWNRVGRKINGIVGLLERMRTDPRALPRTPKSAEGAEIATQSIRYVLDGSDFKTTDFWSILQAAIDGVSGVQIVPIRGDTGDIDFTVKWVVADEYFYTPTNYRMNFDGLRYEGISKWMDLDAAIDMFPEKEELLRSLLEGDSDLTTNPDREYKWVITATKRIRMVEHWYKHKGTWKWAFYVSNTLIEEGVSPFYDDKGNSLSSFIIFSAAIDQDGDRYGFVRNLKSQQDALNQGKSKTLHIANSRRLMMEKGAVDDVEVTRREWARPDGVVEYNKGFQLKADDTTADLAAFSEFTNDARREIDEYGNTNVASLTRAVGNLSGRALEMLREPGMAELGPFILTYRAWKRELYRRIWFSVQRYWKGERWIRVTDDQNLAQFIQINGLGLDQYGRPTLVNAVGQIDVDIVLDEAPDAATMQQETFELLKGYPPGAVPLPLIIEFSPLSRSEKTRVLQMLMPKPPPPGSPQEAAMKLEFAGKAAANAKTAADARKSLAGAEQAYATAAQKRAAVGTESARAAHLAHSSHLDAAEFARDSLIEAEKIDRGQNPTQMQPQPQQQPQQSQQPMPTQPVPQQGR